MTPTPTAPKPHHFPELAGTYQFSVDQYHRLVAADILGPGDKVELLDGYVLYKPDHVNPPAGWAFPRWRRLRRWTAEEYRRMVDLGILIPDDKVERLEGYLVLKMGQSKAHRQAVVRLANLLSGHLPAGWFVISQVPVSVGGMDPEPDGG